MRMHFRIANNAFALILFFITVIGLQVGLGQEKVRLVGKVTDKDTGEELIGASVTVVGLNLGAVTNVDGEYSFFLPPGKYDIRVSYVGYQTLVKNVEVKAGQTNRQDIQLKVEASVTEEIVVEASISNATDAALLTQQRKSNAVSDAISAEFIKKTPDSDAGEAAKRITGVSLVGGKFVFVRGLGERYNNTQINGANLPSPEPEKRIVPFDIIPANVIENIVTIKTFLPDQPGTFAGGTVKIRTKEFPDEFTLVLSAGAGFNPNAHFREIPKYSGGRLDFLGIDDGTRRLPDNFPSRIVTPAQEIEGARLLSSGVFFPTDRAFAPNQNYVMTFADQFNLGELPIGYILSLNYSNDVTYRRKAIFFPSAEEDVPQFAFDEQNSLFNVNWGGIFNMSLRVDENNKFGFKNLYNRVMEDETLLAFGVKALSNDSVRSSRLRYVERSLFSTQITGTHFLNWLARTEIEWLGAYSKATRLEPDNRETAYIRDAVTTIYNFDNSAGRNLRFFSDLSDEAWEGKLDFTVPFLQWDNLKSKIKFGGAYNTKRRNFSARRFTYQLGSAGALGVQGKQPDELFTAENVERGLLQLQEATLGVDTYSASEVVSAGYVMTELPIFSTLRFIGGVRLEQNKLDLNSVDGLGAAAVPVTAGFDRLNILPSLNLIYSPIEAINFRLAFSQTIAQPELREFAPFRFDDYRTSTFGNPFLQQTQIQNYDFRFEWYPRVAELFAISAFYKVLDKPIERVRLARIVGSSLALTVINSRKATNFGAEFEIRKRLDWLYEPLKNFTFSLNVAFINSQIEIEDTKVFFPAGAAGARGSELDISRDDYTNPTRPMQGQSPFIVNANLAYENSEIGFSAILLYNIVGRRISEVGVRQGAGAGIGDQNQDTYEEARNQLDLSIAQRLFKNFSLKLNLRNILDDRFLFTVGKKEAERYRTGQAISLTLSYSP